MTDKRRIDWIQETGAQVWHDRKTKKWTLFVKFKDETYCRQPTRNTLREVVDAGINNET